MRGYVKMIEEAIRELQDRIDWARGCVYLKKEEMEEAKKEIAFWEGKKEALEEVLNGRNSINYYYSKIEK